jgi:hypothetical protein
LLERGAVVELEGEVEGFVPLNQLGTRDLEKPEDAFAVGDELNLKIIEFDPTNKRIVLSVDAYYRDKDRAGLEKFLAEHPTRSMSIGDSVGRAADKPEKAVPAPTADEPPAPTPAPAEQSDQPEIAAAPAPPEEIPAEQEPIVDTGTPEEEKPE